MNECMDARRRDKATSDCEKRSEGCQAAGSWTAARRVRLVLGCLQACKGGKEKSEHHHVVTGSSRGRRYVSRWREHGLIPLPLLEQAHCLWYMDCPQKHKDLKVLGETHRGTSTLWE